MPSAAGRQEPPGAGRSTPRLPGSLAEAVPLRAMYGDTLRQWLQFGSRLSVPNLKRHTVQLSNRWTQSGQERGAGTRSSLGAVCVCWTGTLWERLSLV